MTVNISYLLGLITSLFESIYNGMLDILKVFTTPIGTLIAEHFSSGTNSDGVYMPGEALGALLKIFGTDFLNGVFGDFTLLEFMLGAGLGLYITWKIIGWGLDLLP